MRRLLCFSALLLCSSLALAQSPTPFVGTVTLTVNKTVADGKLVPVLTWSTAPVVPTTTGCTASGGWSGAKAPSGTETLPEITASATYKLTCNWDSQTGSAQVSWVLPITNTDGSPFTDLKGTRIYYGTAPDQFSKSLMVTGSATSQKISALGAATWYFMVRVVNANDVEAADSNVVSKVIGSPPTSAAGSASITIRPVPLPAVVTVAVVANVPFVPVFRVNSIGTAISSTPIGLIPLGRACGTTVSTWRGKSMRRVVVQPNELWQCTGCSTDTSNLAAPCA